MAGLIQFFCEEYLDKAQPEVLSELTEQIIEERVLVQPASGICPTHTRSLMAVADSFERSLAGRRNSIEQIMDQVKIIKKQVKHKLTRLNSFENHKLSKEFGAELRRVGDLFDKDPSVKIKLGQLEFEEELYLGKMRGNALQLRKAADQFDKMVGKPQAH